MSKIEAVQMFICPETGTPFKTMEEVKASIKKAKYRKTVEAKKKKEIDAEIAREKQSKETLQAQRDYIRLNAKSLDDIHRMMVEKSKEFFDIDVTDLNISVGFSNTVSCSHGAPIGCQTNWSGVADRPRSYPGWSGQITASVKVNTPKKQQHSFSSGADYLCRQYGFNGFHTSSGCPGSTDGKKGSQINIGFYFFIQDFPFLQENYNRYLIQKEIAESNTAIQNAYRNKAIEYAQNHPGYIELQESIQQFKDMALELYNETELRYLDNNKPDLQILDLDWDNLKATFTGRRGW